MANLVEYVKTAWENGKTALNAARMNNMEKGISDCATQINKLGDSVSRFYLGDAGTFFIGWDASGPYLAVRNKDNSKQVSFRLSDSGNDNKPSTVSIDLKTDKADTLWQARQFSVSPISLWGVSVSFDLKRDSIFALVLSANDNEQLTPFFVWRSGDSVSHTNLPSGYSVKRDGNTITVSRQYGASFVVYRYDLGQILCSRDIARKVHLQHSVSRVQFAQEGTVFRVSYTADDGVLQLSITGTPVSVWFDKKRGIGIWDSNEKKNYVCRFVEQHSVSRKLGRIQEADYASMAWFVIAKSENDEDRRGLAWSDGELFISHGGKMVAKVSLTPINVSSDQTGQELSQATSTARPWLMHPSRCSCS